MNEVTRMTQWIHKMIRQKKEEGHLAQSIEVDVTVEESFV